MDPPYTLDAGWRGSICLKYQWPNSSSLVCNKNLQLFWFWILPVLHQGGQNRLSFLSPQKGHSRKYNGWIATKTQTHYRNNHWIIINKHCRNKNEIKIDLLQCAGHLVQHAVLQEIGINHILYLCKIRSNLKLKNILFETDITKKNTLILKSPFSGRTEFWHVWIMIGPSRQAKYWKTSGNWFSNIIGAYSIFPQIFKFGYLCGIMTSGQVLRGDIKRLDM